MASSNIYSLNVGLYCLAQASSYNVAIHWLNKSMALILCLVPRFIAGDGFRSASMPVVVLCSYCTVNGVLCHILQCPPITSPLLYCVGWWHLSGHRKSKCEITNCNWNIQDVVQLFRPIWNWSFVSGCGSYPVNFAWKCEVFLSFSVKIHTHYIEPEPEFWQIKGKPSNQINVLTI